MGLHQANTIVCQQVRARSLYELTQADSCCPYSVIMWFIAPQNNTAPRCGIAPQTQHLEDPRILMVDLACILLMTRWREYSASNILQRNDTCAFPCSMMAATSPAPCWMSLSYVWTRSPPQTSRLIQSHRPTPRHPNETPPWPLPQWSHVPPVPHTARTVHPKPPSTSRPHGLLPSAPPFGRACSVALWCATCGCCT